MNSLNLVSSLHELSETDPVEVDGIQFSPTCVSQCQVVGTIIVVQTVCAIVATCV